MKEITFIAVLLFAFMAACSRAENSSLTSEKVSPSSTDSGSGEKMMSNSSVAQVSLNQAEQTQTAN